MHVQGSAAEFPDRGHSGHKVAISHKRAVRDRFTELATAAGLHNPDELADQLLLLVDGAWVAARMFGPDNPARSVTAAAENLIAAHT